MTAIRPETSPCRPHPCSLEHADLVATFRERAAAWQASAEQATGGYAGDLATYRESCPPPSFKTHLIQTARERAAAEETDHMEQTTVDPSARLTAALAAWRDCEDLRVTADLERYAAELAEAAEEFALAADIQRDRWAAERLSMIEDVSESLGLGRLLPDRPRDTVWALLLRLVREDHEVAEHHRIGGCGRPLADLDDAAAVTRAVLGDRAGELNRRPQGGAR